MLKRIDAALDDTVPANRPITLRDLLTFRAGYGLVWAPPGLTPIQKAMSEAGLQPGPLPLTHQPGDRWMYHTGSDVLGILIARASGESFEAFLRERIFAPLGMNDTGFHVPPGKLDRLASAYAASSATRALEVFDDRGESRYARPPSFPSGGGGLVSTADDYLAFCRMLLASAKAAAGASACRWSCGATTSARAPGASAGTAATARRATVIPRKTGSGFS